jgi:hypothetical protein
MSLYTSQKEKRPWVFVILLDIGIYSTLGLVLEMAGFL